ncbi:rCG53568 [Rattus norvegicus]|uniref:RCG53568 n=1 Tax=Rattus norvegicus TaxID=10116 RepID=A6J8E8_RAT|nr:rCG53568 [Rattus norvegicus]
MKIHAACHKGDGHRRNTREHMHVSGRRMMMRNVTVLYHSAAVLSCSTECIGQTRCWPCSICLRAD